MLSTYDCNTAGSKFSGTTALNAVAPEAMIRSALILGAFSAIFADKLVLNTVLQMDRYIAEPIYCAKTRTAVAIATCSSGRQV